MRKHVAMCLAAILATLSAAQGAAQAPPRLGSGRVDAQDFETLTQAVRRQALATAAPGREGGCRAAFAAAIEAEVEALIEPGKADAQDFEALEQAVRRQTLTLAALMVARRLNADDSDHSGSTIACACGQTAHLRGPPPENVHHGAGAADAGTRLLLLRRLP